MKRNILFITLIILNIAAIFLDFLILFLPFINIIPLLAFLLLDIKKRNDAKGEHPLEIEVIKETASEEEKVVEEKEEDDSACDDLEKCNYNLNKLAERFYYLKMSIPIIEKLSQSTKDFEEKTLKSIFNQFEEIWNESETIVKDSEESMESIFDTSNRDNMGYILNSSKEINRDFSTFLPVLEHMSNLTDQFINTSLDSFNDISKTTKEIEELAEQVKVISINVRIEAARIKDSGGFKVLGEDITSFADKTTMFAQSTNVRINNTLDEIKGLKNQLSDKLLNVREMVNKMYKKVNPFEEILEKSAHSLKSVMNDLNKVSGELNKNLKHSLGSLQYQDVTSQESQHIIEFLKSIEHKDEMNILELLDEDEMHRIKRDILVYLDHISTTGNEAEKIKEFGRLWGVSYKDEVHDKFDEVDDGTFLF